MKRTYVVLTVMVMFCMLPVVAVAFNDEMKVFVNGNRIEVDLLPQVHDEVVFLPLRMLEDPLKLRMAVNATKDEVSLQYDNKEVYLQADNDIAYLDGREVLLKAAPYLDENELYIPMSELGEWLGLKVNWDRFTSSVFIFQKGRSLIEVFQPDPNERKEDTQALDLIREIRSESDRIVIQLDRLQEADVQISRVENRIIVDLSHTYLASTLNGQKAEHLGSISSSTTGVERIRYSYFHTDPSTIRIVLDTKVALNHELVQVSEDNQIIVKLDKPDVVYKVVIDAGHGGKDPGAEGASKNVEKHFNLNLATKIDALLQKEPSLESYMTRTDDSYISLNERAQFANDINADLFISIHGNTYEKPISGTETYYWNENSYEFAQVMHKFTVQGTGLPDRDVRKVAYRVLTNTEMPAALLEIGYLSNPEDEQKMLTESFQDEVAESIVQGIKSYLGLHE